MKRLYGMEMFVEVATQSSFTRAAQMLNVPKSTLSRQVAELEKEVGLRLLSRTTRKVELTEAGRLYFERCQHIVAEAQIAHEELQSLAETPTGPLRINLPTDYSTDFLAEVFVEFAQAYPHISFRLDLAAPEHAQRVFGTCDVEILINKQPEDTRIARLLGQVDAGLYASPSYLARRGEPLTPEDLVNHECIAFRSEHGRQTETWPLNNGDQKTNVTPSPRFSVNNLTMMRQLAINGAGIAIVAGDIAPKFLQNGQLRRLLPDWKLGPFPVYAVTDTRLLPAKTRIFLNYLSAWLSGGCTSNSQKCNTLSEETHTM